MGSGNVAFQIRHAHGNTRFRGCPNERSSWNKPRTWKRFPPPSPAWKGIGRTMTTTVCLCDPISTIAKTPCARLYASPLLPRTFSSSGSDSPHNPLKATNPKGFDNHITNNQVNVSTNTTNTLRTTTTTSTTTPLSLSPTHSTNTTIQHENRIQLRRHPQDERHDSPPRL